MPSLERLLSASEARFGSVSQDLYTGPQDQEIGA
jgi:hypothetical protein